MANFSGKIPNFSLPWQQGLSKQSLTDTIKFADLDNPPVGESIWGVFPAQVELYPILCWKSQIFVAMATGCHGNGGMSEPNVTGIVELADPENYTIEPKIATLSYIQPKLWRILW